jgi:pyruvate/2-oxoglutarate dehydrogenase complex dihydrolipoamide dehydrogenase (E3) component
VALGGLTAARIATSLGAHVLLIEKERLGGDCLHYGCVPSKSLIQVARVAQQMRGAAKLGLLPANPGIDMAKVSQHIQEVIGRVAENEQVYEESQDRAGRAPLAKVAWHAPLSQGRPVSIKRRFICK